MQHSPQHEACIRLVCEIAKASNKQGSGERRTKLPPLHYGQYAFSHVAVNMGILLCSLTPAPQGSLQVTHPLYPLIMAVAGMLSLQQPLALKAEPHFQTLGCMLRRTTCSMSRVTCGSSASEYHCPKFLSCILILYLLYEC